MSGELKHGPLALIDKAMPIIMIVTRDPVYKKCMNALQQVTAREGRPIVICEEGDDETKNLAWRTIEVPRIVDCLQVSKLFPFPHPKSYTFETSFLIYFLFRFDREF